jgi:hypothetical protein
MENQDVEAAAKEMAEKLLADFNYADQDKTWQRIKELLIENRTKIMNDAKQAIATLKTTRKKKDG